MLGLHQECLEVMGLHHVSHGGDQGKFGNGGVCASTSP